MDESVSDPQHSHIVECWIESSFNGFLRPSRFCDQLRQGDSSVTVPCDAGPQNSFRIAPSQDLQEAFVSLHAGNRSRIEHNPTADGHHWRKLADNEAVSGEQERRIWKLQPRIRLGAWSKLLRAMQPNLRNHLHRVGMEVDPATIFPRMWR